MKFWPIQNTLSIYLQTNIFDPSCSLKTMLVKLSLCLLIFLGLLLVAAGFLVGGIVVLAFSADALQDANRVPAWVHHWLVPVVVTSVCFGVILPPILYFFDSSLFVIASSAVLCFALGALVFVAAAVCVLPAG